MVVKLLLNILISSAYSQTVIFNNITSPVNLSTLFIDVKIPDQPLQSGSCLMTNYVDTANNNKTYFWLSQSIFSSDFKYNDIIDNVYDNKLSNGGNSISGNIPYIFTKADERMSTCTSPLSNDIIECYLMIGCPPQNDCSYIDCHIFRNKGSSSVWSKPFTISGNTQIPDNFQEIFDILCFNDSYLVIWSMVSKPPVQYFYSVIELNGNVLKQNISFFGSDESTADFTLSSYTKTVDGVAIDSFLLQALLLTGNGVEISNVICNYTNYTVNYVNGITATLTGAQNAVVFDSFTAALNATDPFNALCCYVTSYWSCDGARCGVYLSINDFDGTIGIIQLVNNTDGMTKTFPVIKELKMYNKDDEDHYFVVIYLNGNNNVQGTVYNLNDQRRLLKLDTVVFNNVSTTDDNLIWLCAQVIDNGENENLMIVQSWEIASNPAVFAQTYSVTLDK
eukprot:469877_1